MIVRLIMGAPASGKSTYAQKFVEQGYVRLNRDTEGGRIIGLLPKMEKALSQGSNVVLDNTYPTVESRKPFIELAHKYNTEIECVMMNTPYAECVRRNELRQGKTKVELVAIKYFFSRLQYPTKNEGFDSLHFEKYEIKKSVCVKIIEEQLKELKKAEHIIFRAYQILDINKAQKIGMAIVRLQLQLYEMRDDAIIKGQ